jgi:hypothetical protein
MQKGREVIMKCSFISSNWIVWSLVVLILASCSSVGQPQATSTPVPTSTSQPTATKTFTLSPTNTQTATPEPTETLKPSATSTPTITSSATATPEFGLNFNSIGDKKIQVELIFNDISLEFPETWEVVYIDPHSPVLSKEILDRFKYEIMLQLEDEEIEFILVAYDDGTVPQVYERDAMLMMIKMDYGFPITLDFFDMEIVRYLREDLDPDVVITHDKVALNGHQGIEFTYQDKYIDSTASELVDVMVYRYIVVDGTEVYSYWLSCPCEVSDKYKTTFQQIGRSFKLNK